MLKDRLLKKLLYYVLSPLLALSGGLVFLVATLAGAVVDLVKHHST